MSIGYNPNGRGQGSWRTTDLPKNWKQLRGVVLARDNNRCQVIRHNGKQCPNVGSEVDHIIRGDDHSLSNLQAICKVCHNRKTHAEGREVKKNMVSRPKETHPFLK